MCVPFMFRDGDARDTGDSNGSPLRKGLTNTVL